MPGAQDITSLVRAETIVLLSLGNHHAITVMFYCHDLLLIATALNASTTSREPSYTSQQ